MYIIIITISCIQIKIHFFKTKKTDNLINGGATSLMLWELQKITKEITETKEEHTFNFRMIKPNESSHFNNPLLNTTKTGLIRLSVYNSVFNIIEINKQFMFKNPQAFHQIDATKLFFISPGS